MQLFIVTIRDSTTTSPTTTPATSPSIKNLGNGYVWHTTGSGKTLTSFTASTLLKANAAVDKCVSMLALASCTGTKG